MTTLTTKIYIHPGNEVRRLELNPNVDTLKSIQAKLKQAHEISPLFETSSANNFDYVIQYLDDESEWITVTTEEEWKVALKVGALLASTDPRAVLRVKCNLIQRPKQVREPHRASPQPFPIINLFDPQQRIQTRPEGYDQPLLSRTYPFIVQRKQTQEKKESFDLDNLINSVVGTFFVAPQEINQEGSSNKVEKVEIEKFNTEEKTPVEEKKESSQEVEPNKDEQLDEEAPIIGDVLEKQEKQERELISEDTKEQEFEYPIQLASLIAMGFANEESNKNLLRKNHGDITKTLTELLKL